MVLLVSSIGGPIPSSQKSLFPDSIFEESIEVLQRYEGTEFLDVSILEERIIR
jgi:hypothetical protein